MDNISFLQPFLYPPDINNAQEYANFLQGFEAAQCNSQEMKGGKVSCCHKWQFIVIKDL